MTFCFNRALGRMRAAEQPAVVLIRCTLLLVVQYLECGIAFQGFRQILGMDEPMFFIRSLDVPSAGRILVR